MRLYRTDPDELAATAAAQTAKNSAEEVLHPAGDDAGLRDPGAAQGRLRRRRHRRAAGRHAQATGLRIDPRMGELARKVGAKPSLYRGLRPEALAMALYIGAQVRAAPSDAGAALTLTSTVRDQRYQARARQDQHPGDAQLLPAHDGLGVRRPAPLQVAASRRSPSRPCSTGCASLNLIAWVREPARDPHHRVERMPPRSKPLLDRVR